MPENQPLPEPEYQDPLTPRPTMEHPTPIVPPEPETPPAQELPGPAIDIAKPVKPEGLGPVMAENKPLSPPKVKPSPFGEGRKVKTPPQPLTKEQQDLADQWRGFAIKTARQLVQRVPFLRNLGSDDVDQEAMMGLMKAAQKYDPAKGTSFSTMVPTFVKNHLLKLARKYGLVRSSGAGDRAKENASRRAKLSTLGMQSLNVQKGENSGEVSNAKEPAVDPDAQQRQMEKEEEVMGGLQQGLASLSPKEKDIIERLFGLGGKPVQNGAEIGREIGVSAEYIRQVKNKVLEKLREFVVEEKSLQLTQNAGLARLYKSLFSQAQAV